MKRILITNDDGIQAAGLHKLAEILAKKYEVWVVAPDGQRSGVSHSLTIGKPLVIKPVEFQATGSQEMISTPIKAFTCSGAPADCTKLGITVVMPEKPDFVISGINHGPNVGPDIQYSGTVGAAMEGSMLEVPSIAVSMQSPEETELVDQYLLQLVEECMEKPLDREQIWNINFPSCKAEECKGERRNCKVSHDDYYNDHYDVRELEDGAIEYILRSERNDDLTEGTDLHAMLNGYIAVGVVSNIN